MHILPEWTWTKHVSTLKKLSSNRANMHVTLNLDIDCCLLLVTWQFCANGHDTCRDI